MFRIFGGKKAKVEEKASQAAAQAAKDAPKPQPQKAESKPPVETPKVEFNFRKDFTQIYSLGRKIAEGSFGSAHVCLDIETNQQYAAKVIYKKTLTSQPSIDDVNREERILRTLGAGSHRNFIDFYGAFEDDVKVIFVLEFCTGGELLDMILMKKQHSEKHARDVIRQILQVVAHCHLKGVIHRDIKPQNFLLANISSDSPLKIIDFGLSDFFGPDTVFRQPVGTTLYAAPELLQRSYGPLADLWSVGVISYILLSGEPPFWANTETGVFRQILRGHLKLEGGVWDRISTEAKDFIRGLLDRNPETRLTAAGDVPLDYKVLTSMKDFAKQSKVRQMFMFRVAETFMDDEIKDLRDQFSAMDQDNDGCISIAEMAEALRSMRTGEASTQSINEDQIEEILKGMDVDGNGLIDYSEFVAATLQLSRIHRGDEEDWNQRTLQIFESIDRDNSGFIDPVELAHALGYGEDVEDVIREADTNEDGVIDYEEFSMLMRKVTGGKSASEQ